MPGRVVSRRFIGREQDIARVDAAIGGAGSGVATTVLVAGSAGMGASRFLDQVLERAAARPEPPLILRGRANGPVDPPWTSVLEALGPLLDARPDDELRALLRRDARPLLLGLPRLADLAAGMPAPRTSALADPERRQPRALEALLRWLGRVAAERPIVLALEDLHVADAATRAFATFVSRIAREERLSLVLTWQPDRLTREHPLRENLAVIEAGLRAPVRVDLAPLTRREIGNQIEGIEGERPSASVVVLVAERSAGTPLVIEELIAARRELKHVSLTGTLGDLIAARLARRSHECRRVLRLLAPSQRPMERDRLAVVSAAFEAELATANVASNLPPRSSSMPRRAADGLDADLAAGLAEAIEHGFVREEPDGRLRIRHELVARAVVTDLLPTQRPRYRAALATAFADIPIVAAHHWRRRPPPRRGAGRGARGRPARARARGAAGRARRVRARAGAAAAAARGRAATASRRTGRRTASGWPRSRSWRPRRPPRPAAPAARRSTRRAASRRSGSGGTGSSTRSSRRGSAATGSRRATARARPRRCARPPT